MHELGICDALLRMLRSVAQEEQLEEIVRITVEVGSLSGVVPNYLADCWVAVTDETEFQDVEFVIEELDGTAQCLDCGETFVADLNRLRCPKCAGDRLMPLTGQQLTLKSIEVP